MFFYPSLLEAGLNMTFTPVAAVVDVFLIAKRGDHCWKNNLGKKKTLHIPLGFFFFLGP